MSVREIAERAAERIANGWTPTGDQTDLNCGDVGCIEAAIREACAPLVEALRIYDHPHATGNSVPPHIVARTRAALAAFEAKP